MKELMNKLETFLELGGTKKDITFLVISGIALILSLAFPDTFPVNPGWIAILLCGVPIILEAVIGLVTAFDIKADVLVSLALIASLCIGETFAAAEVAFIMQLGGLLEELTVAKARAGIEKLVHLTPQTARVICSGADGEEETIIAAEDVKLNDILRVLPGETIPVDGVILSGQTSINQAVMTGESLPVDKAAGDEVSSGTVNQFGTFTMKATKVGEDSSIQRMIRLVQSADAGKAKIVGIADRWATWIVVIALTAAVLTWFFTGQIIRSVTILVVFCPCALVLATPTAIMAAIGNATKHGFLVREGDALERLASVQKVTFDKTGTLTYGTPEVIAVQSVIPELSDDDLYLYTAACERLSEHPLGKAIVKGCRQKLHSDSASSNLLTDIPVRNFQMIPGRGISAYINEQSILAGNLSLLSEQHISVPEDFEQRTAFYLNEGATVIYVAYAGKPAGFIALADTLRPESQKMIDAIRNQNIDPVLLTGDHENAAQAIARRLHIQEVCSDCLPEDKLNEIDHYQRRNLAVCMIGDGINDAPALKKANVGIAMGGVGSDIAVDAADIALIDDQIEELPHLLALSRRMMRTIRLNLTFSMTLNFVAIVLAISGILNPIVGALVHNAGSVLVIINSAFLLKWRLR